MYNPFIVLKYQLDLYNYVQICVERLIVRHLYASFRALYGVFMIHGSKYLHFFNIVFIICLLSAKFLQYLSICISKNRFNRSLVIL